jgi:hypothetical protein
MPPARGEPEHLAMKLGPALQHEQLSFPRLDENRLGLLPSDWRRCLSRRICSGDRRSISASVTVAAICRVRIRWCVDSGAWRG